MRPWQDPKPVTVPPELAAAVGGHPLVVETLVRRGITEPARAQAFLDPLSYRPCPAQEMPGVERAVARLAQAVQRGERIGVWGDFDVDGQTATALLVSALTELGADMRYHIPVRAVESHGINLPQLKELLTHSVTVLITCDTGISAHEQIAYAQEHGVDVILTDHHELPPTLPPAFSVTNPRLLPAHHPLAALPGVGTAYKLVEALYAYYHRPADAAQFLDLVALGIVADVAELSRDCRFLLQQGLESLRTTSRAGLKAIFSSADLNPQWLTEEHIGFSIAPRLNAIGRLGDANPMVELLTTRDDARARTLAAQIEALNDRRKLLTNQVYQGALAQIKANPDLLQEAALVLANPYWPAGVIGIVASRLVDRFQKPVILIANPDGEAARGSARSVPGVHITQAIAHAASEPGLLHGYGGHAAAAGLSLNSDRIPELRRRLGRAVTALFPERPEQVLEVDGWLPFTSLSLDLVADLERLAPFGPGNPALVLGAKDVRVISTAPIGRTGEHIQIIVEDGQGQPQRVLWWQGAAEMDASPLPESPFDLAYSVRASSFGGQRQVQVEWIAHRLTDSNLTEISSPPRLHVIDHRQTAFPVAELEQVQAHSGLCIWAEGDARQKLPGLSRQEIGAVPTLVIWSIPPGRRELEAVLAAAAPVEVHLFALDPGLDHFDPFLARLSGLVKHVLAQQSGTVSLVALAAAMAHRPATVQAGLAWLESAGFISFQVENGCEVNISHGKGVSAPEAQRNAVKDRLSALLKETAAFRAYYRLADSAVLLQTQDSVRTKPHSK
jgi:single-stranded-DNA-specific exonuclease